MGLDIADLHVGHGEYIVKKLTELEMFILMEYSGLLLHFLAPNARWRGSTARDWRP